MSSTKSITVDKLTMQSIKQLCTLLQIDTIIQNDEILNILIKLIEVGVNPDQLAKAYYNMIIQKKSEQTNNNNSKTFSPQY
jgi:hypothetical protein